MPMVKVKDIIVEKNRGRKDFTKLPELLDSIERLGLIHPLVVTPITPVTDGKYTLVTGERRLRAVVLLGWEQVPVTVQQNLTTLRRKEIELDENLRRQDLSWPEEIELLRQLDELKREQHGDGKRGRQDTGWTVEKTGKLVGKSKTTANKQVQFAKLLQERPDLKERLSTLPLKTAIRSSEQILEGEKTGKPNGTLQPVGDLKLGDAQELLKSLGNESVDCVVTDPPVEKGEEPRDLLKCVVVEMERVLKPGGHIYMFFPFNLYSWLGFEFDLCGLRYDPVPLIWDKGKTTSPSGEYLYSPCYEGILFGWKLPKARKLNSPGKKIIATAPDGLQRRIHPLQKPLSLLKYLIRQSTDVGEMVLDPFAGSGNTLLAAGQLGRESIGFEIEKEYFLTAQNRLKGD